MLDKDQRKAITSNYKERHPEMEVVCVKCKSTGEQFFEMTRDTSAWFNRHRFELIGKNHRNKRLQELWNQYGEDAFELATVSDLEYDNVQDVASKDLKELPELCLSENPEAKKI